MGWCHEFGPQISDTCEHPITAGATSCSCSVCGVVCAGRFAGCAAVWARGPRPVDIESPRAAKVDLGLRAPNAGEGANARWRLPLDPLSKPMGNAPALATITPAETAPALAGASDSNGSSNGSSHDPQSHDPQSHDPQSHDPQSHDPQSHDPQSHDPQAEEPVADPSSIGATLESPDITARFAVAQLTELNERLDELTELATKTTGAGLEKVYGELRRVTSLHEVDLTEQAAGIFGAVQAGTDSLEAFAVVVREVTDDLRRILGASLAAIGGAEGLAVTIAEAQADVAGVREDFGAALARIERDLAVMRQRIPAKAAAAPVAAKIPRDQIDYIVEAVTEAVVDSLKQKTPAAADKRGARRHA